MNIKTARSSAPGGFLRDRYFATFVAKRQITVATAARVALAFGSRVEAVRPPMRPLPTDHCMAEAAQELMLKLSS